MDMVKDFSAAAEIMKKFTQIKNPIALAMVIAGIKEVMEPTIEAPESEN